MDLNCIQADEGHFRASLDVFTMVETTYLPRSGPGKIPVAHNSDVPMIDAAGRE